MCSILELHWWPIHGQFDLRLLLREGGQNLLEMPEPELYERACEHGWAYACQSVASAR